MQARKFNNFMGDVNEKWAADVLGMELCKNGPDLINNNCILEVKFSLLNSQFRKYTPSWTVLEYQMDYEKGYSGRSSYWGLGIYSLSTPVYKISNASKEELENLVLNRELWIIPFSWMTQFPPSETRGKTRISEWENTLRYPKIEKIPETIKIYEVKKGKVNLTNGVNANNFSFLQTGIKEQFILI
jgi:hypothetical protein